MQRRLNLKNEIGVISNFQNHPKATFFITKKAQRTTKDTKLDVDGASLCVLCGSLCFLCENYVAFVIP